MRLRGGYTKAKKEVRQRTLREPSQKSPPSPDSGDFGGVSASRTAQEGPQSQSKPGDTVQSYLGTGNFPSGSPLACQADSGQTARLEGSSTDLERRRVTTLMPDNLISDYERLRASQSGYRGPSANNRCSMLGHPCAAYCFFDRTVPAERRAAIPEHVALLFAEGRYQERVIMQDLLAMGYDVVESQGSLAWPTYQITGHRDMKISKAASPVVRCEFKSVSPYIYDKLNTVEELRDSKLLWVRKWYSQVVLYMLLDGEESYWLILKNKSTGRIKVIVFAWNDEMFRDAEALVKKAEKVNRWVTAGQGNYKAGLPEEAKLTDAEVCADCEFFAVCLPPLHLAPDARIIADDELATRLARREELQPAAKEFDELDGEIKDHAKAVAAGASSVVCGDWLITLKNYDVKEKRISATTATRVSISKVARGE